MNKHSLLFALLFFSLLAGSVMAQEKTRPEETEVWSPVPKVVKPGKSLGEPPSDAIILFNGKNLEQWVSTNDTTHPAKWVVKDGILTVNKGSGNIQTKESFMDYQIHLEWRVPKNITGSGQGRGNSGLFLASIGKGDDGYEMQIMDS